MEEGMEKPSEKTDENISVVLGRLRLFFCKHTAHITTFIGVWRDDLEHAFTKFVNGFDDPEVRHVNNTTVNELIEILLDAGINPTRELTRSGQVDDHLIDAWNELKRRANSTDGFAAQAEALLKRTREILGTAPGSIPA